MSDLPEAVEEAGDSARRTATNNDRDTTAKQERRRPDLDTVYTINPDGSRNFLHPADTHGRFQVRKAVIYTILMAVYAALPFVQIGGHPAVLFDIGKRSAYLFGTTFTNQDFYLSFFVFSGIGFGLFVVTSLWGRIWCGYACPQTVWLEGLYRRFERWIEGSREQRIRRNAGSLTFDTVWRKGLKHAIFVGLSFGIAHVFIAYFLPIREVWAAVQANPREHWTAFLWATVTTGFLYFDYAWFREQTCLIICPYGRLQSALIDTDTIIIGYDEKRGEPRSKKTEEGGDCIDCNRCVVVCPTGIDIRNGLQMECVGCANCIDACDEIMDKIGRPRGLVRYDSRRGLEEGKRRGILRPRVFVYAVLGLIGIVVATVSATSRSSFEAHMLRSRGMPYVVEETRIQNLYTLRIQNKTDGPCTYHIQPVVPTEAEAFAPEFIVSQSSVRVAGLADVTVPIFGHVARDRYRDGFPLAFAVTDSASGRVREVAARFRGP